MKKYEIKLSVVILVNSDEDAIFVSEQLKVLWEQSGSDDIQLKVERREITPP